MSTATLEHPTEAQSPVQAAFARYHTGWETKDPDYIAAHHSADSVFLLHDGSPAVVGRENIRRHVAGLFRKYTHLAFEPQTRVLYGRDRVVFEYVMLLSAGGPVARVPMVDVFDFNEAWEVTRKEVFIEPAQAQAALVAAGLA